MTHDENLNFKRDAFRKWLEQFDADDCIKLLCDLYQVIEYKHMLDLNLKGGPVRAN